MRRVLWVVAVLVWVVPGVSWAQDGLRSASFPEHRPSISDSRDVFRVDPDFYQRPPDPSRLNVGLPYFVPMPYWYVGGTWAPDWWDPGYSAVRRHTHATRHGERRGYPLPDAGRRPPAYRDDVPPAPSVDLPALAPGIPKTFYVIPGCYAGDKPPQPEWLRPGCDVSSVRIIPPSP